MRRTTGIACGVLAALLCVLNPATATAQTQVKGSGVTRYTVRRAGRFQLLPAHGRQRLARQRRHCPRYGDL
jgi:hypothetical protein